jgi:mRNA-degrading endonuclease RelE of RelBE toxin-antitoxin system
MVIIAFSNKFTEIFSKIKDNSLREKIIKQIEKIKANPKVGKPMKYDRKDTRELYIKPFRLSYIYIISEQKVVLLDFYHKDEQ